MGSAQDGARRHWCRWCGQQVSVSGDGPVAKAVHAATGLERGEPDGHAAAPIDFEPQIWADAREIAAVYGGVFTVTARFGKLRADWANLPPGAWAEHYTADGRDELTRKLDTALGAAMASLADGTGPC